MSRLQNDKYTLAKNHFRKILNEASGFPGECCENGVCVPVSFTSASHGCVNLGLDECLASGGCPDGGIDPLDVDLEDDIVTVDDVSLNKLICVKCENGLPVGNMFPGTKCPPGWIEDSPPGTVDPCGESPVKPCDIQLTLNGSCAQNAGMPNSFVGNMTNSAFFQNMDNGFRRFGCRFFVAVRQKHQDMIDSGMAVNGNHPAPGTPMGPLWIAQKQSKIDYLNCMLNGPCCSERTNGSTNNGTTMG